MRAETSIPNQAIGCIEQLLSTAESPAAFNGAIYRLCGIREFIEDGTSFRQIADRIGNTGSGGLNRVEFGDFQTPLPLAEKVCRFAGNSGLSPEVLIEPTFGKGSFLLAAIRRFPGLRQIFGIEINSAYVWESKMRILDYYISHPELNPPEIRLFCSNVFDFDFSEVVNKTKGKTVWVAGNPPWVTNAGLGRIDSGNLPSKSNFLGHRGLDALTGKGNFDIGESVCRLMLDHFSEFAGGMDFLVKQSVIRKLLISQKQVPWKVANWEQSAIDAKKEFGAAVDAALLSCKFGQKATYQCRQIHFDFPSGKEKHFGWVEDKFVSDVESYGRHCRIDQPSPFVWRSGVKHDCTKVFILRKEGRKLVNGFGEIADLEEGLLYPFLKGSALKGGLIRGSERYILLPQQKPGQETEWIRDLFPKTYAYLLRYKALLDARKSSIYRNQPSFSIFGLGEYSFLPYKVGIAGLYKSASFSLILPADGKAVVLDDTCYQLGFGQLPDALFCYLLLNSALVKAFLGAVTFVDHKRVFTKEALMRIGLEQVASETGFDRIAKAGREWAPDHADSISPENWNSFLERLKLKK